MTKREITVTIRAERGWLEHAVMRDALRQIAEMEDDWSGCIEAATELASDALAFVDGEEE